MTKTERAQQVTIPPPDGDPACSISAVDARELTDRIKNTVDTVWHLVADAYQRRAWIPLGYPTWDEYTSAEFGSGRIKIPREERAEVVSSLRDAGLSTRAIGAATGVGRMTVHRELAGVSNGTVAKSDSDNISFSGSTEETASVVGLDGRTYRTTRELPPAEGDSDETVRRDKWMAVWNRDPFRSVTRWSPAEIYELAGSVDEFNAWTIVIAEHLKVLRQWFDQIKDQRR
jgi:hypothetical protein